MLFSTTDMTDGRFTYRWVIESQIWQLSLFQTWNELRNA